ncbi:hypothetical protein PEDI_22760 [Persicobacter diffluens]|uniref:Uncharacterized protein n=1 Tax=Persicobacter diffluens TaxID=981 RepID=A0AAN4VX46_9BACT|nr:hypothetical protein PEDI_22760 [Persicobacter diffluens]
MIRGKSIPDIYLVRSVLDYFSSISNDENINYRLEKCF